MTQTPLLDTMIRLGILLTLILILGTTYIQSKPHSNTTPKPVVSEHSSVYALEQRIKDLETGADKNNWDDICDRSIVMQNELLDRFHVNLCRAIAVRELYRIQDLAIVLSGDDQLRAGDFIGMTNLVKLSLDGQGGEKHMLPAGIAQNLESLKVLIIDDHDHKSVLAQVTELPNLIELDFHGKIPGKSYHVHLHFTPTGACVGKSYLTWLDELEGGGQVLRDFEAAFGPLAEC